MTVTVTWLTWLCLALAALTALWIVATVAVRAWDRWIDRGARRAEYADLARRVTPHVTEVTVQVVTYGRRLAYTFVRPEKIRDMLVSEEPVGWFLCDAAVRDADADAEADTDARTDRVATVATARREGARREREDILGLVESAEFAAEQKRAWWQILTRRIRARGEEEGNVDGQEDEENSG